MSKQFIQDNPRFVLKLSFLEENTNNNHTNENDESNNHQKPIRRIRLSHIVDEKGNVSYEELKRFVIHTAFPEEDNDEEFDEDHTRENSNHNNKNSNHASGLFSSTVSSLSNTTTTDQPHKVKMTYVDVDSDLVCLDSTEELIDAIEQYREKQHFLRIFVKVEGKQQQQERHGHDDSYSPMVVGGEGFYEKEEEKEQPDGVPGAVVGSDSTALVNDNDPTHLVRVALASVCSILATASKVISTGPEKKDLVELATALEIAGKQLSFDDGDTDTTTPNSSGSFFKESFANNIFRQEVVQGIRSATSFSSSVSSSPPSPSPISASVKNEMSAKSIGVKNFNELDDAFERSATPTNTTMNELENDKNDHKNNRDKNNKNISADNRQPGLVQQQQQQQQQQQRPRRPKQKKAATTTTMVKENDEHAFIHGRHTCDACLATPIIGKRFHAINVSDYDLCEKCRNNYKGNGIQFEVVQLARDTALQGRWRRHHRAKLPRDLL